jgi:catechol 2,3-dioxygenase
VRLTVGDADLAREFYERVIGLRTLERREGTVCLGADGARALIELNGRPNARPRPPGTTGLYHLAILVPSRRYLALALRRLITAGCPLAGASDHQVSEALYLSDPDGNGIEIYRDRPRDEWRYRQGSLEMATLPLDLEDLAGELRDGEDSPEGMPPGTRIGHVHLQVGDLAQAESFYGGVLRFEVTVREYPGALFLSAGGYHHHIGLNTWAGVGAPAPPPESVGLRSFEVLLPSSDDLERAVERARAAGAAVEPGEEGVLVPDPSRNGVLLTAPAA